MPRTVVVGIVCLLVGLVVGALLGRSLLEREWSQPNVLLKLSEADAQRSTGKDANPTPKAGTVVLRPLPLARARQIMAEVTRDDPVVLKVGAVGNVDEGVALHLVLRNRGKCKVTSFSGVAYGFDAYGRASPLNKGGESYVGFSEDKVEDLDVDKDHLYASLLHHVDTASLALAQVDQATCADGTRWVRQ